MLFTSFWLDRMDGHWLCLHLISNRLPKQLELGGNDYIFFGSYLACVTLVHRMNSCHEKNAIHEKMIAFSLIFFHLSA